MKRFVIYTRTKKTGDVRHKHITFFELPLKVQMDLTNGHATSRWHGNIYYKGLRK